MKKKKKGFIIAVSLALAAALAFLTLFAIFNLRNPVIIVAEQFFIDIYGEKRLKKEVFNTSMTLFRPVKIALIDNKAGEDVVPYSVSGISSNPYCVLFPRRFLNAARLYKELFPNVDIVILEGQLPITGDTSGFFVYRTDIESDYYKAAAAAANIAATVSNEEIKGKIVVFMPNNSYREVITKGITEQELPVETLFYATYSDISKTPGLACVVLAGLGGEILDKIPEIPVITFSWLDPSMMTNNVILVIDDSPLAQAVQAVKMAKAAEEEGFIKSKFIIIDRKIFNNSLLQIIRKIE